MPTSLELRARSTTEIIDAAVQLYRRDAARYILLGALAYAPILVLQTMFLGRSEEADFAALSSVLLLVTFSLMSGVVARVAAGAYLGREVDVEDSVKGVLPLVPRIIGASIVRYFITVMGILLLIIGMFYFLARFFATTQAIVLEGTSAMGSLRRSGELSKGLKRHILNTLILSWIIYFLLAGGLGLMVGMFGGELMLNVASAIFTAVVYPIVAIVEVVLYYDARVKNEGYDIEVLAGTPAAEPAHA